MKFRKREKNAYNFITMMYIGSSFFAQIFLFLPLQWITCFFKWLIRLCFKDGWCYINIKYFLFLIWLLSSKKDTRTTANDVPMIESKMHLSRVQHLEKMHYNQTGMKSPFHQRIQNFFMTEIRIIMPEKVRLFNYSYHM